MDLFVCLQTCVGSHTHIYVCLCSHAYTCIYARICVCVCLSLEKEDLCNLKAKKSRATTLLTFFICSKKVLSDLTRSKTVWQHFLLPVSLTESCEVQNKFKSLTAE